MSTVFILGAGASRSSGGPLMHDFIERATEIHRRGESLWASYHFENVLNARKKLQLAYAKSNVDLDNIENLFLTFEMASLIGNIFDFELKRVEELPASLRYLIMRTLERSILYPLEKGVEYVRAPYPYNAFAELLVEIASDSLSSPVSVINFNYDLCLDYALTLIDADFDYGIEENGSGLLNHYKVHGSLNWFQSPNTASIEYKKLTKQSQDRFINRYGIDPPGLKPIDTMEIIHGTGVILGQELDPDPVIVPPTWNKIWYQMQLKSVWRKASLALSTAENIYVIGYSLPVSDQFFKSFFSISTLSDSIIDKFVLYDPSGDSGLITRFETLLGPAIFNRGRFRHERLKFSEAIKSLANQYGFEMIEQNNC